jgi:hypothetical protein
VLNVNEIASEWLWYDLGSTKGTVKYRGTARSIFVCCFFLVQNFLIKPMGLNATRMGTSQNPAQN